MKHPPTQNPYTLLFSLCSLPASCWHLMVKWGKLIYRGGGSPYTNAVDWCRATHWVEKRAISPCAQFFQGERLHACVPAPTQIPLRGYSLRPRLLRARAQFEIRLPAVKTKQSTPLQMLVKVPRLSGQYSDKFMKTMFFYKLISFTELHTYCIHIWHDTSKICMPEDGQCGGQLFFSIWLA